MPWVRRRWRAFWFEPRPGFDLAVCRIIFFGGLLAVYGSRDLSALGEASPVLWQPLSFFRWLPGPSPEAIRVLQVAWCVALACATAGLATRLATLAAFAGGLYLLGLPHNFGATRLDDALLVLALAAMAIARCGDAISVDGWLAALREPKAAHPYPPPVNGEYTWPIRLVWVLMAMMYFGSGFAKLRMSGVDWVTSDHIARLLIEHRYGVDPPPAVSWGPRIAASPPLSHSLAGATLATELFFPIALVSRRARWFLLPAAYAGHVGIRLVLGSDFLVYILVYSFWVPWRRVIRGT